MKIVLEFEMPDDQYSMWCSYHAVQIYSALNDIQQKLRSHRKHGTDATKTLDDVHQRIVELHNEIGEPL